MIYEVSIIRIEPVSARLIAEVWGEARRRFPRNLLIEQLETIFLALADFAHPQAIELDTTAATETDLKQIGVGAVALARGFAEIGEFPAAVGVCEVIARLAADAILSRCPSRSAHLLN